MADPAPPTRLDSWKAIADYLRRDVATARRWEKLGLPVHRVPGGRGRSVFAFPTEIDAWLSTSRAPAHELPPPRTRRLWLKSLAAIVLLVPAAWAMTLRMTALDPAAMRVNVGEDDAAAFDATSGRQLWRYEFPSGYRVALSATDDSSWRIDESDPPAVFVAYTHRVRRSDGAIKGGELTSLNLDGVRQRTFSFEDQVTFAGKTFGPPWGVNAFAVDDTAGRRRIAVAGHHFTWNPGLVTLLDEQFARHGTFVHDGWIETVHWISPTRLLVSGFSNAHDGGMVALLDADALDGQGPEPAGSSTHCDNCATGGVVRMAILPRSEINRTTASPFNHALVQLTGDRITAHTIEVPSAGREAIDAVYEFSSDLELLTAGFSDRYWETHRALEAQGKIDHARDACPDSNGPRAIQMWDRTTGWARIRVN